MKNQTHLRMWMLYILITLPQISETIYSPALPNIAEELITTNHMVQWTLSIYFVGFAIGVFIWGRLSDRVGRRGAMVVGLLLYVVGSVFCLSSQTIEWLLAARLFQGLGISVGSVVTQAIAREALSEHNRHRFFGAAGFLMAFSIALGPFVGGYLTGWFNWQANFTLLVILGGITLFLVLKLLPETRDHEVTYRSTVFSVAKQLICDKHVLGCVWIVAAVNAFLFCYYAESPFIFMDILHFTPHQYGWLGALIALAALLGSLISRRLVSVYQPSHLILIGAFIIVISTVSLMLLALFNCLNAQHILLSTALIMLPMMGIVFGSFGFVIPMTLSTVLVKYKNVLGTAGALFGLAYYAVLSVFTWVMGAIHDGTVIPMPVYFAVLGVITLLVFLMTKKQ